MTMWFEKLTGFAEVNPAQVRENIELKGDKLISKMNQRQMTFGRLDVISLGELRQQSALIKRSNSKLSISEVVGNVQSLHADAENNGAIFQAASQFNLLEMVGPHVSPERGVGIYENDATQGPACAIACGAGTIYRNYFAEVNGKIGQTQENQIDCLADLGNELQNSELQLWKMTNGYALPTEVGLQKITELILAQSSVEYDKLKSLLKIGVQWNTEVTINESQNSVSQAYCSALPVSYSHIDPALWEVFARLILEATYEATLHAALINFADSGNNRVYLTLVGGGAFGNARAWIFDAMRDAIFQFSSTSLDIRIVSYGSSSLAVKNFIDTLAI